MSITINNKTFKALSNTENGEVSSHTVFHYHQEKEVIWAKYGGGNILKGFLIGKRINDTLTFSYQHVNVDMEILTGNCNTRMELNEEDRVVLYETWQWTCKDCSKGESVLIEV